MKKQTTLLFALLTVITISAQSISEVKISSKNYGISKAKKGPKRVFINSFNINYEVYKEAIDVKTGGSGFRGKKTGDATARAAVGLSGIEKEDIQAKTDQLYQDFIADFKVKGYEFVSVAEASKIKIFEGWETGSGPYVNESGVPGVLTSVPSGYSFLYKSKSKSGKIKKGLFGGALKTPIISKQLENALVVDVNLYVMYSEEAGGGFNLGSLSKVAKVKIKTNLRLADEYAVVAPKKPTKLGVFGSIGVKGATTVDYINSSMTVTYGKMKIGAGAMGQYNGMLKKSIEINGVMKKDKISAYQKQATFTPTSFNSYGGLNLKDRFSKNTTWVKVDSGKYADGLYNACSGFLKNHTQKLLDKLD